MRSQSISLTICFSILLGCRCFASDKSEARTVFVTILSKGDHILIPYFLNYLEALNFPKNKMSLYIRTSSSRKADQMLNSWTAVNKPKYNSIDFSPVSSDKHIDDYHEEALEKAREKNFDYIWYLTKRTILTDPNVLHYLMRKEKRIISPMMYCNKYYYSNFWGDIDEHYDYRRSHDYTKIVNGVKTGCFKVPVLTTGFLIDLRENKTEGLSFQFGEAPYYAALYERAKMLAIDLWICNEREFGWIIPDFEGNGKEDAEQLKEFKETMFLKGEFPTAPKELQKDQTPRQKSGMDKIYVINLLRRPFRKKVMEARLKDAGLDATFFEAIDWKNLNSSYLDSIGFNVLDDYDEVYMTHGAIGTGLSHYFIWEDIIRNNYQKTLILEDDVIFDKDFKKKFSSMLKEAEEIQLDWDLIYIARFVQVPKIETRVENSTRFIHPVYSVGAFGYILSLEGAKKLFSPIFTSNMIPVDDYIVLKYLNEDDPRNKRWKIPYCPCDLKAFSVHPLIAHHKYFESEGYIESDTLFSRQYHEPIHSVFGLPVGISSEEFGYCHKE